MLDAQFFGVPQRRKRIFVVGHLGDWRPAAAVLLESQGGERNFAPGGKEGKDIAVNSFDSIEESFKSGIMAFEPGAMSRLGGHVYENMTGTIRSHPGDNQMAVAFKANAGMEFPGVNADHSTAPCIQSQNQMAVVTSMQVRRLTPRECERLQGFPDDWTKIPYRGKSPEDCPDGPRYKAIGNSMAVPCMSWIGKRIAAVDAITDEN
jgi:DNA (cytosine-5)-methyltransferase 1